MTSNLRSARSRLRARAASGTASKSRKGWYISIASPRSSAIRRTSAGVPSKVNRSFSKISTPSNPAAAAASSFSGKAPLSETVAMHLPKGAGAGAGAGVDAGI